MRGGAGLKGLGGEVFAGEGGSFSFIGRIIIITLVLTDPGLGSRGAGICDVHIVSINL